MNNDPNQQNPYPHNPNQGFYTPNQTPYTPAQFNQPPYNPGQQYPPPPTAPQRHKRAWAWYKRQNKPVRISLGCLGIFILLMLCATCSGVMNVIAGTNKVAQVSTPTSQVVQKPTPTTQPTPKPTVKPTSTPKPKPTPTPKPKLTPAQIEAVYKSGATDTTVSNIDKNGNTDQYKNFHFICTIVAFVKNADGNTAGANVSDPNDSSIIQVEFTPGTDITQINAGDTLEVWGVDAGTSSGQNAFGATVQEAAVQALYLNDTTTGYQAHS